MATEMRIANANAELRMAPRLQNCRELRDSYGLRCGHSCHKQHSLVARNALAQFRGQRHGAYEQRSCSVHVGMIDVRASGRAAADSDGTIVPIGSVMLSRVTLSRNSCSE